MNTKIENKLDFIGDLIEFDGVGYRAGDAYTPEQWESLIMRSIDGIDEHGMEALLEAVVEAESGYIFPTMEVEEIILGSTFIILTPVTRSVLTIDLGESECCYQIKNNLCIENLLDFLGAIPVQNLVHVLRKMESIYFEDLAEEF